MGISISTDVVKFVAHGVIETSDPDCSTKNDIALLLMPESFLEKELDWQTDDDDVSELVVGGWKYDGFATIGNRGRIYADRWRKGKQIAYLVNEDQYAAGGGFQLAIVADDRETIEQFCQDQNLKIPFGIEENDAVSRTG